MSMPQNNNTGHRRSSTPPMSQTHEFTSIHKLERYYCKYDMPPAGTITV